MTRRFCALAIVVVTAAFAACGGDDEANQTGDTASRPAAETTASASPAAAQEVSPSNFLVPLSFTAAPGFEVVNDEPNDFAVERPEGSASEAAYLAFFVPNGVFNPETAAKEGLPQDLGQWVATNDNLEILTESSEIEIGGYTGVQLDARGANQGAPALLLTMPDDEEGYHLGPLEPARFVVLDVNGTPLVIVGGPFNRALFDEIKPDLEAMIESIQFE
jgi:hypothetical protein